MASGVLIGLTAAALQLAVDLAARNRNALLDGLLTGAAGLPRFFGALLAISSAAVLLLTLVVHFWAPKAAGGGVALVMAYLNGASACSFHAVAFCSHEKWGPLAIPQPQRAAKAVAVSGCL